LAQRAAVANANCGIEPTPGYVRYCAMGRNRNPRASRRTSRHAPTRHGKSPSSTPKTSGKSSRSCASSPA